jgi:hypothetical protein
MADFFVVIKCGGKDIAAAHRHVKAIYVVALFSFGGK